ncbi:MAG TPA: hypothetical protein VM076_20080 [Gemmatimonadaceae bacterium]|nr:hypothetical protein [Gemmatimonadaceae bacterium]
MTNPRRPDDGRLTTADLAAAGDRATERTTDQQSQQSAQSTQSQQSTQRPAQPATQRAVGERDVTQVQHSHGNLVADAPAARQQTSTSDADRSTPLFAGHEADDFRRQWADVQTGFVDEPRQAVERADALVATAIKRLAEVFAHERGTLEQQWARGGDVSTEDLRVALRRYRGFFDRLLSV